MGHNDALHHIAFLIGGHGGAAAALSEPQRAQEGVFDDRTLCWTELLKSFVCPPFAHPILLDLLFQLVISLPRPVGHCRIRIRKERM